MYPRIYPVGAPCPEFLSAAEPLHRHGLRSRKAICPHCHGRVDVLDFAAAPPMDELRGWTLASARCENACPLEDGDVPERHALV
jgi:hypothetical protein